MDVIEIEPFNYTVFHLISVTIEKVYHFHQMLLLGSQTGSFEMLKLRPQIANGTFVNASRKIGQSGDDFYLLITSVVKSSHAKRLCTIRKPVQCIWKRTRYKKAIDSVVQRMLKRSSYEFSYFFFLKDLNVILIALQI